MVGPHLVVHYHRIQNDYHAWSLVVFPKFSSSNATTSYFTFRQPWSHSLTSFGAVFRIDLAVLGTTHEIIVLPIFLNLNHADDPPRSIDIQSMLSSGGLHHIFIAEGCPDVHSSPVLFSTQLHRHRFLFFSMTSDQSPLPVLHIYIKSASQAKALAEDSPFENVTVFPATSRYRSLHSPVLFVLDLFSLRQYLSLYPRVLFRPDKCSPRSVCPPRSQCEALTIPSSHFDYYLRHTPNQVPTTSMTFSVKSDKTHSDPATIIRQQPQICPALSAHFKCTALLPSHIHLAMSTIRTQSHSVNMDAPLENTLAIFFHNVDGSILRSASILAKPRMRSTVAPSVVMSPKTYRSAPIAHVDLSTLSRSQLAAGLTIFCETYLPLDWAPSLGYQVIFVPTFPRLLTPAQVDIRLYYHRFGDFDDWTQWRLRLSCQSASDTPARSILVRPHRPHRPGIVFFDLIGCIFPYDAVVRVELFRLSAVSSTLKSDEAVTLELGSTVPSIDRRDVLRTWKSGHSFPEMHAVQGDSELREEEPSCSEFQSRRMFRLRYRRFLPNDYDSWDLWTWDDTDPSGFGVPIAAKIESSSHAWVDFEIDRANYGASLQISVLPRRGGGTWLERDDPIRVWNDNLLSKPGNKSDELKNSDDSIETFIIVQSTHVLMRAITDARHMMDAFVESETSIVLLTPVPISWISPPRKDRPRAVMDTSIKFCDERVVNRFKGGKLCVTNIMGKSLRFAKIQEISPAKIRLLFTPKEVEFTEDFLVEQVIVTVPGFDAVILHWERFDDWDKYLYDGLLGWDYQKEKCLFKCFAPTADGVSVVLYNAPTGKAGRSVVPMRRIPQGCWKAIVRRNLKGKYYKLLAEGENKRLFPGVEVIDPYSRCNTAHNGRGFIFGVEGTKIAKRPNVSPHEAIIYELHIRDISIDKQSGISQRGKFCGLAEQRTRLVGCREINGTSNNIKWKQDAMPRVDAQHEYLDQLSTGLDHIAQMGITAVQILPIQDFDNDESDETSYRWGYMPVHFNSPDGWYSSSLLGNARVTEFKKLVNAFHKAGIKVIMDVVYNHTAEDSNEFNLDARFSFNGLVPRYYYRTCGNTPVSHTGHSTCGRRAPNEPRCGECYSNGSGCGNEFRSESPMGRKFIIDSLKYWVNEYQIDGFRFDLMGLIDVLTLTQASAELHKIDQNIMLYGEPWVGGLSPIRVTEKGLQRSKGFSVFNDSFRNAIRGSSFESEETFVMDGGRLAEVKAGIIGSVDSFCDSPLETINYVECHDNYTLWDHFRFYVRSRTDNICFSEADFRRMHRLAGVLVFTSQGVPFMQAGQELCRTKFDVENSYESPDEINMIRWENKVKEWTTVLYYRGLALLRRSHPEIFCKKTTEDIHKTLIFFEDLGIPVPDRCVAYRVEGDTQQLFSWLKAKKDGVSEGKLHEESLKWSEVVVLLNPTPSHVSFALPDAKSDCIWIQVVDATQAGVHDISGPVVGAAEVPGRSAAVMRRASQKDSHDAQLLLRLNAVTDSFCIFHGDDVLSRYAVGLDKAPTPEIAMEQAKLHEERQAFEERQKTTHKKRKAS